MSYKVQSILFVTGIFVGILTIVHIKSLPAESFSYQSPNQEQEFILQTLRAEQGVLKSSIASLREEINTKEEELSRYSGTENVEVLEKMKRDLGLKSIIGRGIEIIFDDSPTVKRALVDVNNEGLVHAADLRDIINILHISKASGISINDQRILASTPISCVGSSILINNSHVAPPFIIQAVVDTDVAKNNLLNESYLPELRGRITKHSLRFDVFGKEQLTLPVYNGDLPSSFLQ